ncbi:MAG: hypothetical protein VX278_02535 [Myxococcota bacterium]|nr:hypothetical protein [Myxococcota bacterium]
MFLQSYILFILACGSTEKDTATEEDTVTEEDTAETEEIRSLPESGCEQEGWLLYGGSEYYYFMNTHDEEELVVYSEFNDISLGLDNSIDEAHWYTYNAEKLVINQKDDLSGNGEVDQMTEWVYEENGYPVEYRIDNEFDGIYDDEWLTTRDENGYMLEQTFDRAMDGTIDTRRTTEWNEDMTYVILSRDDGDDGTIESITEVELSGVYATYQSQDEDADGVPDRIEAWVYNDDEKVTRYELDDDGDGSWDFVRIIEWLNADQYSSIEDTYYDASGTVEGVYLSTMAYDSDGRSDEMVVTGSADYTVDHRWYCAE